MFEIGTTLRDARVRKDISLQEAEDQTKIRVKYIQAMENEDFEILPGGTYVKGFLRTYAEYLGLDYQLVLDEYNERYGSGEHREHIIQSVNPVKIEPPSGSIGESYDSGLRSLRSQKNRNYLFVAALAISIIAVLAYLGWGNQSSNDPTIITTTEVGEEADAPAETAPERIVTQPQTPPPPPPELETVALTSTVGDNWVELRRGDATGEIIWGGTLSSGDSMSFTKADLAVPRIWMQVGSANGLEVTVNGIPQDVPQVVGASYMISAEGMNGQR
ncbi:MAG: helix-turn-helix domain-containing protein [Thermoleophilia bacterium]|nr:helix-turn-helix domain-containing protein [Thermoleophilia bacterium]